MQIDPQQLQAFYSQLQQMRQQQGQNPQAAAQGAMNGSNPQQIAQALMQFQSPQVDPVGQQYGIQPGPSLF